MYNRESVLVETFAKQSSENKIAIEIKFSEEIQLIQDVINAQHQLITFYLWSLDIPEVEASYKSVSVLFSAYHKNILTCYSAFCLTREGFYGAGRMLLRYIFEALMLAKLCTLSKNTDLLEQWTNGQSTNFTNSLKRIVKPDPEQFIEFWKMLCKYSHATIYSQQADLEWTENQYDIALNFLFIRMLLECNYHLVNSYLINASMRYYAEKYIEEVGIKTKDLRKKMQSFLKKSKKNMQSASKTLIYKYKLKWQLS